MRSALAAAFHGAGGLARGVDARAVGAELFAGGLRGVVAVGEAVLGMTFLHDVPFLVKWFRSFKYVRFRRLF